MRKLFILATVFLVCAQTHAQTTITINAGKAKDTISRHIYGHFAEHLGRCVYGGFYVGEGNKKIPNKAGIRLDIVDALKKLKIPNLRWPGGCFADNYHWKDAIGPKSQRKHIENFSWGGVREDNSFGTNEFLSLCEMLGAEPYLAVNMGSGTVEEAADWVKYVNHPNNTSWLTDLRQKSGRTKPWNVKFWGVGNESWDCGGHMTVDYYINEYKKYATFMTSYSNTEGLFRIAVGPGSPDFAWTDALMRGIPGKMIEGVSIHHYSVINWSKKGSATAFSEDEYFRTMEQALRMEEMVSRNSEIMDKYDPQKKIALVVDEWGGWYDVEPGTNPAFLHQQNTMRDAMIAGLTLNIFNNHADRVRMANLAQTINVLQSVILTKKEKMILTPTYHVMEMYNVHQDALQLPLDVKSDDYEMEGKKLKAVSASASMDKKGLVHISLVNIDSRNSKELTIELNDLNAISVSGRILRSENLQDHNSFEQPQKIKPTIFNGARIEGKNLKLTLPPFSVVVLELRASIDSTRGLKDAYASHFKIGVAVSPWALKTDEGRLVVQHFNSLTPENAMKMGPIHPRENQFNWAPADSIVAFAQRHNLKMRGHTLVWHQQAPDWLFKDANGNTVSKEVLLQRLKDHITAVVSRYKGKIYAWDVVNEAISDKKDEYLRPSKWLEIIGEEYIAKAFQWAHEADPNAQLFYNDYNEISPVKREKIFRLVKGLKDAGVPINGVGLQGHWAVNEPSRGQLDSTLQRFSELGLALQITELDISVYPKEHDARERRKEDYDTAFSAQREQQQMEKYKMCFELFRKYRNNITSVTFWNISDRHSWLDDFPVRGRKDYPLLFDKYLKPKKAYYEVAGWSSEVGQSNYPFQNTSLSFEERVNDLVSRLTLEEKVAQMLNSAPAIDRLGIPAYDWWNEVLHGVARTPYRVTVYPQAIAMAATFDTNSLKLMAHYSALEGRAIYNKAIEENKRGQRYVGLTYWTPNINIFRDPRWGRGQETYGEDPFLTAMLGRAFVRGLEGDDPKYLKAAACAKHYAVHSGPEPLRHVFNVSPSKYDLWNTYLPAFKELVTNAKVAGVMCAYNAYRGQPCCGSDELMVDILRNRWKFTGYVTSDCWAIDDFFKNHKTHPDAASASADAVLHETDIDCGTDAFKSLVQAVKQGKITEQQIDVSIKRLFMIRFRLGMFDPVSMVKYAQTPASILESAEHKAHSLKMARQSIVLLKNQNNILPLKKSIRKIAVVGPNADNAIAVLGNYNGMPSNIVTALEGIKNKLGSNAEVVYENAVNFTNDTLLQYENVNDQYSWQGQKGFGVEYFNNRELKGEPIAKRTESALDNNWQEGQIVIDTLKAYNFSVRYTTDFTASTTGDITFELDADDGYRLMVDGKEVINAWTRNRWGARTYKLSAEKGKRYRLVIEYYQGEGKASVRLRAGHFMKTDFAALANRLKDADAIVFVGGISPQLEGEEMRVDYPGFNGGDRTSILLPVVQTESMRALKKTGKPVVFVMMTGSAIALPWEAENVPAIINAWYGGQDAGTAIADVLFGDYNPAGRLPVTFYKSDSDLPDFNDYSMSGRTYRYFKGTPLYEFGFGLSYTTFHYSNVVVNGNKVSVNVKNTGKMDGEEVVQLYISAPIRSLKGFQRIFLKAGETKTVEFNLTSDDLSVMDDTGNPKQFSGKVVISVGGAQPGNKNTVQATIDL